MTNRITITQNKNNNMGDKRYEYEVNKPFECRKIHIS